MKRRHWFIDVGNPTGTVRIPHVRLRDTATRCGSSVVLSDFRRTALHSSLVLGVWPTGYHSLIRTRRMLASSDSFALLVLSPLGCSCLFSALIQHEGLLRRLLCRSSCGPATFPWLNNSNFPLALIRFHRALAGHDHFDRSAK